MLTFRSTDAAIRKALSAISDSGWLTLSITRTGKDKFVLCGKYDGEVITETEEFLLFEGDIVDIDDAKCSIDLHK